ncbi:MAG: M15 family metallopeptidase [Halioglobus sp.]
MPSTLTVAQLTGQDESHLTSMSSGHRLQGSVVQAFEYLCADARRAGFDLQIASSFRSFARQCLLWNEKAVGDRVVHDDHGTPIDLSSLTDKEAVHAIMRFSALPGTSRHHWGTDLDIFDASAMPQGYQLQLSPQEVGPDGIFDPLHTWLDQRMAADQSYGFFRPYHTDSGGVAPERWHLSYAPLSTACEHICTSDVLLSALKPAKIQLWDAVDEQFTELFQRYVAVAPGWCPAPSQVSGSA